MKNTSVAQERISALADGELSPSELDSVLASLRQPRVREQWDAYHQIGDVLRSDEMAVALSPGFSARMAARLDAEPTILAPAARGATKSAAGSNIESAKRFAIPGAAAIMAVFAAYLVAPQLMTGGTANPPASHGSPMLVSANTRAGTSAIVPPVHSDAVSASADASSNPDQEQVVLRDPNIDEYLTAHQRYSPSLYDTTQFVRSATFDTEPKK